MSDAWPSKKEYEAAIRQINLRISALMEIQGAPGLKTTDGPTFDHVHLTNGMPQEAWIAPVLLNSWANFGGGCNPAGYFKDSLGMVHLQGMIKGGTVTNPAFVLPVGYRPAYLEAFATVSNALFGYFVVLADGTVRPDSGSNLSFSLDGTTFRAA